MGWVSWPLYNFVFLTSLSAPWWPNIRPKNGVSGSFGKTIGSIDFILYLAFTLMGWVFWPLFISVFLASFSALWWPNIWHSHLCSTRMQNINLYWIFLVEVGSDQSGGILSPFMGTACCCWNPHYSDVRMNIMASQIIGDSAVCLIVRLDWYKKIKTRVTGPLWSVDSPHKGPVTRKTFPFHGVRVIMHICPLWP